MKIAFIIPFKYNWSSYPSTRATYETLQNLGHEVTLFVKTEKPIIEYNNFDQIWLIGSGVKLSMEEFDNISVPVIGFGLSDPNLYSETHMENCDMYCTNDARLHEQLFFEIDKKIIYNPTSCDKRHHKNLNLPKTTDILVYGVGEHKFIPNRNKVVNKLRNLGFNINVFGRGWNKHKDTVDFIKGEQLIKEINKAKLILDITNQTTALGRRIFEGSACATPVLTRDREDIRQLFTSGHHILTYNTFDNIVTTLTYVLKHPKILQAIGLEAQQKCYDDHDISIRIQELLKIIKESGLCKNNI